MLDGFPLEIALPWERDRGLQFRVWFIGRVMCVSIHYFVLI
jgi:hypothetical protein